MSRSWLDLLRSLGASLVGVAEAEAAALKGDLRTSGRQLAIVVALAAAALLVAFWLIGALGFFLFQLLALWLPRWAAALVVVVVFLALAAILAAVARWRLRSIEPPGDTVRRHVTDHMEWWQSQVLMEPGFSPPSLPDAEPRRGVEPEADS